MYWGNQQQIKRLKVKISPRYWIGAQGQQLLKTCGRGVQRKCFIIDWYRLYKLIILKISLQYAKQQTSGIILVQFLNNSYGYYNSYKLKRHMRLRDYITITQNNFFFIRDMREQVLISNLELYPRYGIQLIRSAGTRGKIVNSYGDGTKRIKLPSGKFIIVGRLARAVVGANTTKEFNKTNYSKAGTSRRLGKRIHVRGTAMNAVDHPHGGKSGPSRTSVSPWGWVTK